MEKEQMRQFAMQLAKSNVEADPTIKMVLWFPHTDVLRLVVVADDVIASDEVIPFYFGPDRPGGLPVWSGIALVRAEEVRVIPLPDEWGKWDEAEELDISRMREAG